MAGLLDMFGSGFEDPKSAAIMALAGGLLQGNFGGGLLGANQAFSEAKNNAAKQKFMDMQMQTGQMTLDEQKRKLADEASSRKVLQDFYAQRGMPGTAPVGGPTGAVNAALPSDLQIGALPATPAFQQQQPGGVTPKAEVWKQYTALGDQLAAKGLVQQAQQYYGLADKMRPKYSTTPQVVRGPDGKLINVLIGEDGTIQPMQYGVKPDMVMENLGGSVRAIDKNSLNGGEAFQKTVSPDTVYSGGITMRGQNMTDARSREANNAGKVPAGYRLAANGQGLEFIPGGPADPNAAKKAAPTEFQGKAAMFGNRAQEADRILSGLDGKYMPSAVNAKEALGRTPLVGGALEAGGNLLLSDSGQKAEQAQRDFVNAVLRLESGAAISQGEFDNAKKQYFPQPMDSTAVKAQKAANRKMAIQGLLNNARPGSVEPPAGGATGTFDNTDPLGLRK